jgi:ABC-type nitrate/sulfonate/bicarbonate transport system substrate-binding protein
MRPVSHLRIAMFVAGLVVLACAPATQPTPKPAAAPPPVASPAAQAAPASGAAPARPTDAPLNPAATVRVGVVGATGESGLYVAEEQGYFRQQGITIEWAQFQAGQQMIPLLGSGQLDVGSGGVSAGLINAVALDIPLRIVADEGYIAPGSRWQGIVVRKELVDNGTFGGCPNYKGLRVANVTDGNTGHIVLARTLRECGLELTDIDVVLMSFGDMMVAFQNGAIDAAFILEPFLTRGVEEGLFVMTKSGGDAYPGQQGAVVLYAPQFIANRREVGQRFMVGYLQGVRAYTAATTRGVNRAEVIGILSRLTSVRDPAVLDRLAPVTLNPDGYINVQAFGDDVAWWYDRGYTRTRIDPAQVVDHSFVDYAIERLGRDTQR